MAIRLGPYGERVQGRVRLTWEGRDFLEAELAKCDGFPIRLLMASYKALAVCAVKRDGRDAVNHYCCLGMVDAALRYRPRSGEFLPYATDWIRHAVQTELWLPGFGMTALRAKSLLRSRAVLPTRLDLTDAVAHGENRE